MATRTSSLQQTNNTDANFRLWINEIHNSLIAFGWTQTSDTGQINFSTATRPTNTNLFSGYAVYAMGDALQSTAPFYLRLKFGTGNNTDVPRVDYNAGTATDGAGNIIGNYLPGNAIQGDTSNTTAVNCRTSGSSSSFYMSFWQVNGNGRGIMMAIERSKDAAGANTADGICFICFQCAGSGNIAQHSYFIPMLPAPSTNSAICWPEDTTFWALLNAQSTQSAGGNIGICPVRVQRGYLANPMLGVVLFSRTDFTMETTFTLTHYGASHTYLALRPQGGSNAAAKSLNVVNSDNGFGILWE